MIARVNSVSHGAPVGDCARSISCRGPSNRAIDLSDGTDVIREMRNAGDEAGQIEFAQLTRRSNDLAPRIRFRAKLTIQSLPFRL
jgi:hypothetical protein